MLSSAYESSLPSSDLIETNIKKSGFCLATTMPCCVTSVGRRGVASVTLFCVCTCAMSGLVPGSKVSVICAAPLALDVELKYIR